MGDPWYKNNTTVDIDIDDQDSDAARQKVLDGGIVTEVLRDALKVIPCFIVRSHF